MGSMVQDRINVLDHGFVRLVDHMGSDVSVSRAARVSYDAAWRAGDVLGGNAMVVSPSYEDRHVFAVWSSSMATAVSFINRVGCAHMLMHIVPAQKDASGYWLIFKGDSWLKAKWLEIFPDAEVLSND